MPSIPTSPVSSAFPTTSARTVDGVTHVDLTFASAMSKGSGSIFVTDGAVQTVIDRVTGQPRLRVVGGTFSKEISLDQLSFSGTHVMFDAAGLPAGATLNVFMGAGALLGGGQAIGAITKPGSAVFTTPEVVVVPPALSATIELDGNSLKSGEDIAVTISFSRAVENLPLSALAAGNANIGSLDTFDGGKTWVATLTGVAATDAPANVLRLNMDSIVAGDGSRGAGVKESASYLVDTLVAAYVGTGVDLDYDAGPSRYDGVSNEDTMSVSGLLYGSLKAGESIELQIDGRTIDPGKIQISSTWSSGVSKWTYADEAEHFGAGGHTVQVRVVGAGHSSQTATKGILIDQDAPLIVTRPTAPVDAAKPITLSFNERMYWEDNVEVTRDIKLVDSFGNTSWIDLEESMLSIDGRTLTLSAAEHDLASGNSYTVYLPSDLTDLAGNHFAGPAIGIATSGPYQDKAPPRLLQTYIVNGNGSYGLGDVLEFRLRFSEKVNLQAGAALELNLSNGKVATYAGLANDGTEMSFTYTIGADEDSSALDTYTVWSVAGHVLDDAGNVLQNSHIEYDGSLSTSDGYGAMVKIDTRVVAPGAARLHADSDSGAAGDNSTLDATPRLTGSGAEAGATVSIYGGDVKIGSATADAGGNWDTVVTVTLDAGTHQITVIQEDVAGNVSAVSAPLALTIEAAPPPAGLAAPVLDPLSDTGASNSDGLTLIDTPAISGKGPAGTTLTLTLDGVDLTTVATDASGDWSYLPSAPLADGVHSFSVRQGTGAASPALSITVDKGKPSVSGSPDGATAFDPAGDIVISFSEAVHIAASEGDEGSLVLRDAHNNLRRIALSEANLSSDKHSLTISAGALGLQGLADYAIQLPATLTDLAGNAMSEYEIHFRTGVDGRPSVTRVIVDNQHDVRAGESITFRIRFSESVERVGADEMSLGLNNGARAVFSGISGNEASFSYTVAAGEDQDHLAITDTASLVGHIADLSGNLLDAAHIEFSGLYNGSGYGTWIDIDTIAPTAPNAPQLDVGSNSGSIDDLLTSDRIPTIKGSGAEAWASIELYEGDTLLGNGYADEAGNWDVTVASAKALNDGAHTLTVRQVDDAGNRGPASAGLVLTVDRTAPNPPGSATLALGSDSGTVGDGLTKLRTPTLSGSGADADAVLVLYVDGREVGRPVADASGNWTYTISAGDALAEGVRSIQLRQLDAAGNQSELSDAFDLTVDVTAAAAPGRPVLAAASDSGSSNSDGITNVVRPNFSGSGAEAGATIVLYADSREIGRKIADADGKWDLTVAEADQFTNGSYAITAKQIDMAGNTSEASSAFSLVIDTAGPTVLGFDTNRSAREFQLGFSEQIVFRPSGLFKLIQDATEFLNFSGNNHGNWYLSDSLTGHESVLNFKISLTGLYNLSMNNSAVQDLAGNAAVIGTPQWLVDLPGISS